MNIKDVVLEEIMGFPYGLTHTELVNLVDCHNNNWETNKVPKSHKVEDVLEELIQENKITEVAFYLHDNYQKRWFFPINTVTVKVRGGTL